MSPKVSVIVPVYNTEKYLLKCLDSLTAQTLKDIEIICINDCSPDGSLAILQKYAAGDDRIKVIDFKENKGAGAARNAGIDSAKGEYIGFVDSDDFMDLDFYEKLYQKASETGADIVKGNLYYAPNGMIRCVPYYNLKEVEENKTAFIHVPTAIFKRSFLNENQLRYPEDLSCAEDSIFETEVSLKANQIIIESSSTYYYVQRDESLNKTKFVTLEKIKEIEKSVRRVVDILNKADLDKEIYLFAISKRYHYLSFFIQNKNTSDEVKQYVERAEKDIISNIKYPVDFRQMMMKQKVQDMWNKKLREKEISERGIDKKALDVEIKNFKELGVNTKSRQEKIIVSLTSFPQRMYDIHYCIYSLLKQSLKPDAVVLWLGEEQFPNKEKDIPSEVLRLRDNGLTIKWTKDIKSYKKLIPALKEYSDNVIVTTDDDIFYAPNWLDRLYETHKEYPNDVVCHRVHKIKLSDEKIMPYDKWSKCINDNTASYLNFFTGAGGVLYPPHCLFQDVSKEDLFMSLAPRADDVWFWAMAVLNGRKMRVVHEPYKLIYVNPEREFGLNGEMTLFQMNRTGNDEQIRNVIHYYPEIIHKLSKERE